MYIYDAPLNSSQDEKYLTEVVEKNRRHILSTVSPFPKTVLFMRQYDYICYNQTCHRRQYYTVHALFMQDK
jgi:hypothetical protein